MGLVDAHFTKSALENNCAANSGYNLNEKLIWSSTKGNPTNASSLNPTHVPSSHSTNAPTLSLDCH